MGFVFGGCMSGGEEGTVAQWPKAWRTVKVKKKKVRFAAVDRGTTPLLFLLSLSSLFISPTHHALLLSRLIFALYYYETKERPTGCTLNTHTRSLAGCGPPARNSICPSFLQINESMLILLYSQSGEEGTGARAREGWKMKGRGRV